MHPSSKHEFIHAIPRFGTALWRRIPHFHTHTTTNIWGWVKTLVPSEPQNSWYMDVHPTKNGINRY